ncbi:putative ribonuclease H-like domain-containing protein, partial [Tanacetum coccineum]
MALPEDHLAKFHKMTNAKEMWEAIKSRYGGNDESKKMQKYILKQQFEGFSVSNSEGLHKGYDRSLPSAWSQVSLIMRTKPGVDSLSFDDLYNNLRVFESDVKGSTASSSSTQNVAFVSENTSSTNDVSTAYGVSTSTGHNSQCENPSSYSFLANQSSCPQLDHEDLEQLDEFDLEEMDLKWQVAMISMRMKKFYKKTGRKLQFDAKEPVGFDKTKVECYNCHKTGHFARECRSKGNQDSRRRDAWNTRNKDKDNGRRSGKQEEPKALVTLDGDGVDWTSHSEDKQENYALMAYSHSGSDIKVTSCSKECKESYAKLKKLYDEQKEQLGDANDKTDVLTYHKKLLAEAEKEKEELKAKVEKWHSSSKSLNILLNSQMSAKDKAGLGYGDQMNKGVLSYENEVFGSLFDNRSSDIEDSPVNDRYAEGMHVVPPPMTGIYIPSGPDKEIDDSQFTYGPKQSKPSESDAKSSDFTSCESNTSEETLESMPEPVINEPKVVSQPKVWSDAPIIEEYELDSDDEHVSLPTKEQETPSFAFINTIKHVKTPSQTVEEQNTCSKSPKPDKKDCSGLMSKKLGLGYEFTKKACFGTGQRENRLVWNSVQRVNHQNQFVPTAVLTRTGIILVNTASHNFNSQAVSTSAARKVNVVRPIMNENKPRNNFHKSHSPIRRPFNRTTAPRTNFSYQKVNTAEVKAVSAIRGKRETAVKPSASYYNGGPVAFGGSKGYITGKGVKFSRKVTILFDSMLVPHQALEGEGSEQPTEPQPTPSPTKPSTGDQPLVTDSSSSHDTTQDSKDSLEGTNGSEGDQVQPSHDSNLSGGPTSNRAKGGMTLEELSVLCTNLSNRVFALEASKDAQAAKIIKLKTRIKKLKKKSHPIISHHRAWLRSVSRLSMKRKLGRKESVSKQGRKNAKPGPTLDDSTFDNLDANNGMDYMDTNELVNEGRLSKETEELNVTHDIKVLEKGGSNEEPVSTGVPEVSTATPMTPPTII